MNSNFFRVLLKHLTELIWKRVLWICKSIPKCAANYRGGGVVVVDTWEFPVGGGAPKSRKEFRWNITSNINLRWVLLKYLVAQVLSKYHKWITGIASTVVSRCATLKSFEKIEWCYVSDEYTYSPREEGLRDWRHVMGLFFGGLIKRKLLWLMQMEWHIRRVKIRALARFAQREGMDFLTAGWKHLGMLPLYFLMLWVTDWSRKVLYQQRHTTNEIRMHEVQKMDMRCLSSDGLIFYF